MSKSLAVSFLNLQIHGLEAATLLSTVEVLLHKRKYWQMEVENFLAKQKYSK